MESLVAINRNRWSPSRGARTLIRNMAGGSPGCVVCGKPRGPFTVSLSMKLKNKPRAIGFERAARSGAQAADADRRRAAGRTCPRSGRSSKCAGKQSRARRAAGGDRRAPCPRSATVGRPSWVATPSRASGGMMPPVRLSGTRQVVLHNRIFEPVHKGNSLKSLANNGDSLSKPSTPYIDDESPPRLSHNYWAYRLAGRDGHTQPSIPARFPRRGGLTHNRLNAGAGGAGYFGARCGVARKGSTRCWLPAWEGRLSLPVAQDDVIRSNEWRLR